MADPEQAYTDMLSTITLALLRSRHGDEYRPVKAQQEAIEQAVKDADAVITALGAMDVQPVDASTVLGDPDLTDEEADAFLAAMREGPK